MVEVVVVGSVVVEVELEVWVDEVDVVGSSDEVAGSGCRARKVWILSTASIHPSSVIPIEIEIEIEIGSDDRPGYKSTRPSSASN